MGGGGGSLVWPFAGGVDAHDAAQEIFNADVLAAQVAKHFGNAFLRGVFLEGFQDVGVGGGVAAEDSAEERDEKAEVGEVGRAPRCEARFAEIEDEKFAARFEDAKHFDEAGVEVSEISEAVADGEDIESVRSERKVEGVGFEESQSLAPMIDRALARNGKHGSAEFASSDFGAGIGEGEGDIAGAAAKVECFLAGLNLREFNEPAFPIAVKAEALQIVDEVVARRDGGEEIVDALGAFFASGVKRIGHYGLGQLRW